MNNCLIIAHRGANKYAPQNTLPAFERAVKMGADGFETDVHMTKDGEAVLCHNYTIDETSDGKGAISDMTLDELKSYDFGSYFSPEFKNTRIPTLEEFLTLVKSSELKVLNIELKPPKEREYGIVKKTIDMVKEFGLFDILLISSFDRKLLREVKQEEPACRTGFLYPTLGFIPQQHRIPSFSSILSVGADAIHAHKGLVNRKLVERAHSYGMQVNPWTVDEVKDIKRLLELGVDSLITDSPDKISLYTK